ncbi:uncharacterized protein [Dysidea avara]|uniref:uncharacterized protein isoform X2 n=1 Tax=Dysidea avara TaxID=196820 RepID=UPI00331672A1
MAIWVNVSSLEERCSSCRMIAEETKSLTAMPEFGPEIDFRVGDRVLVDGYLPGVVKYVGDLDSDFINSQVYVGVKLDDPVGDSDGIINGKRYFKCERPQAAVFVEANRVSLTVPVKLKPWNGVSNRSSRSSSIYKTTSCINPSAMPMVTNKARNSLPGNISRTGLLTGQTSCSFCGGGMELPQRSSFKRRQASLPARPSLLNNGFTSRLLSNLPSDDDEVVLPELPERSFTDVNQFASWMHVWGGGIRGWTMANTLQKLKDAHRKGKEETDWQRTIDQLEKNGGYDTRIRRIRKLQEEIHNVQASTLAAEEEYTRLAYGDYKSQQAASQINKQIHQETMTCRELEAAIRETIQCHQSKN